VSSVGSFFSYVNDARSPKPKAYMATVRNKYGRKFADYKDRKNLIEFRQSVHSDWVLTDSSLVCTNQYFHIIRRKHIRPPHYGVKAFRKPNNRYTKCLKFLLYICTHEWWPQKRAPLHSNIIFDSHAFTGQ